MGWRPWIFRKDDVGVLPNGMSRWLARRMLSAFGVLFVVALGTSAVLGWHVMAPRASTAAGAVPAAGPLPMWVVMSLPIVTLLVGVVCMVVAFGAQRRAKRVVAAAGGYVCPTCLYDLSARAVDRCSECGQCVQHEALPNLWAQSTSIRASVAGGAAETGFNHAGLSVYEVRARRWGMVLPLLVPLASFGPGMFIEFDSDGGPVSERMLSSMLIPIASLVVFVGPVLVLLATRLRRLKRVLRVSGGVACPRCLADLSGGEVSRCPACEQAVDYGSLGKIWAVRMKVLRMVADVRKGGAGARDDRDA